MDRGSAYGWVRVAWTDGPRERDVEEIAFRYQDTRWDGTDDSYRQVNVQANPRYGLSEVLTRRYIGQAGQQEIDEWFRRAGVTGFERVDPRDGSRPAGEKGYEFERGLSDAECARLGLPHQIAAHYPCVGTAARWYHSRLDFTGDKPAFDPDE